MTPFLRRHQWLLLVPVCLAVAGAGVAYNLSQRTSQQPPAREETKKAPCAHCCCDAPARGQAISAQTPSTSDKKTDAPMFGGTPQRNMANVIDKNLPAEWDIEAKKNVKWVAQLGDKAYGGPTVADGKVFVGTTNFYPRDPKVKSKKLAILMAFDQQSGKFLWQIAHDIPGDQIFHEAWGQGLCSTPTYEKGKLYYVTPACEVVCASTDGKVLWKYDMMKELGVIPYHLANCSPVILGEQLFVTTGNGIDEMQAKVLAPKAPSFIAINKNTGKLTWKNSAPGDQILEGQWSNPAVAVVDGKPQVIFAGGDAILYSFEPETGKLIWQCNCYPHRKANEADMLIGAYMVATPVIVGNRLYVGTGVYPDNGNYPRSCHVLCIDVTKTGDVSPKSLDNDDPANKGSALIWSFGGEVKPAPKTGRKVNFSSSISTCAIHDDLLFIPEERGYLHCIDAKTGKRYWEHDLKTSIWGSAFYADGRIFLAADDANITIFECSKTKKILKEIDMGEGMKSTPVIADGVIYIQTPTKLYAIAETK